MQGDHNELATANRLDLARRGGPATARAALAARPSLHGHARPGSGHTRGRTRRGDSVPFRGGSRGHRALVPGVAEGVTFSLDAELRAAYYGVARALETGLTKSTPF